jgi:hypothetical protein
MIRGLKVCTLTDQGGNLDNRFNFNVRKDFFAFRLSKLVFQAEQSPFLSINRKTILIFNSSKVKVLT